MRARDQVDARGDHGGRVNERGDGRGPFHGVGQPDIKRQLRTFTRCAQEQAKADGSQHAAVPGRSVSEHCSDLAKVKRAEINHDEKNSDQETKIANAIDDKSLLARRGRGVSLEIETDQQVRGEADAFPANEHEQHVARQDQDSHKKEEQIKEAEIPRVALFMSHIADGINVDEKTDAGNDQQHHQRKWIEEKAEIDMQSADRDPGIRKGLDVRQRRSAHGSAARAARRGN